jgi:hypothetical protein
MRVGIRIAAQTERIRIEGNEVTGFAQTIVRDA